MDRGTDVDEDLPEYLQGLEWPAAKDDAIAYAAEYGAPAGVLEYMERLPAAAYASEQRLRQALGALDSIDLGDLVSFRDDGDEADDGASG